MKILRVIIVIMTAVFAACSNENSADAVGLNKVRASAIGEAALAYGAQYALAWRAEIINEGLVKQDINLDRIYNFRRLVIDHNVLPPILDRSSNSMKLSTPNAIRFSDSVIEIIMPARFITTPPTWRDYINLEIYKKPDMPDSSVLPETAEERNLWDEKVIQGWDAGKYQADSIFSTSLARLTRDFNGMNLYRELLAQKMVSKPYVSKANLGITGNSASMRLNDQIARITKPSELATSLSNQWKPILLSE